MGEKRSRASSEDCDQDGYEAYQKRIKTAKRQARSELSVSKGGWQKFNLASKTDLLTVDRLVDGVPRVHVKDLTVCDFIEKYEKPKQPVVITGLADSWPAQSKWTLEKLAGDYGDHKFKCNADMCAVVSDGR
eukprot:TRINITY_DN48823_c0_g1_i1.p2 TRINITY_DN48823_c0_g1~~TRINITY_DN48823_c0_g1_i1.p2  ORF type:complete len:132 (-),score=15.58 TRINITY_DN48823_c0_g1_i1:401-796(-)